MADTDGQANPIYGDPAGARKRLEELRVLDPGLLADVAVEGSDDGVCGRSMLFTLFLDEVRARAVREQSATSALASRYLFLRHFIEAEEAVLDAEEGIARPLGCLACTARHARAAGNEPAGSEQFDQLDGAHETWCVVPEFHVQLMVDCNDLP